MLINERSEQGLNDFLGKQPLLWHVRSRSFIIFIIALCNAIAFTLPTPVLLREVVSHAPKHLLDFNIMLAMFFLPSPLYVLVTPIISACSDLMSRKVILSLSFACIAFSSVLSLLGVVFGIKVLLLFGIILSGLSGALPILIAMVSEYKDLSLVRQSHLMSLLAATFILGPAMSQCLNALFNLIHITTQSANIYLLCIAFSLEIIAMILLYLFLPESNPIILKKEQRIVIKQYLAMGFFKLINKRILILYFLLACFCLCWGGYYQHNPTHFLKITKLSMPVVVTDYVMEVGLTVIAFVFARSFFVKILSDYHMLMLGFSLALFSYLLVSIAYLVSQTWLMRVAILSMAVAACLILPTLWMALMKQSGIYHKGFIMGMASVIWLMVWAVSSLFSIFFAYNGYEIFWGIVMLICLGALFCTYASRRLIV